MGLWTERVVPRLVERTLTTPDVMRLRTTACRGLSGRVLELGFGSGLNVDAYPADVTAVDAVEPSELGWELSTARRASASVPIERVGLDGQRLAAASASYDAVLSTFTLCTIPDVVGALAEARRVLRPGGSLHFLEHGRAPSAGVARWQHRLDPVQRRLAGGTQQAGLDVVALDASYLPGPSLGRPWTYVYVGRAVRAAS